MWSAEQELLQLFSCKLYNFSTPKEMCLCPLKSQMGSQREGFKLLELIISTSESLLLQLAGRMMLWLDLGSELHQQMVPSCGCISTPASGEVSISGAPAEAMRAWTESAGLLTAGQVTSGLSLGTAYGVLLRKKKCSHSFCGRRAVRPHQATV